MEAQMAKIKISRNQKNESYINKKFLISRHPHKLKIKKNLLMIIFLQQEEN